MDETIYGILKFLFDFALEVWFSINRNHDQRYAPNHGTVHENGAHSTKKLTKTTYHNYDDSYFIHI